MRYKDIILAKALGKGAKGALAGWPYMLGASGGGTADTVTGNAPLSLPSALAKAIKSLTQTGLCAQASTPTPSSPVDIYCNNGKFVMVDDELPSGYKRVLGFQCNNNAMWEIDDFHLRGSDTFKISFSVTAACNVWGCYQGADATDNYDLYASVSSGSKYLRYANGTYLSYWSNANLDVRFDTVVTPTGTQGMPEDSTWTERSFEAANDLLIGSTTTTGTSSKLKGNLYGDIIVLNGNVERLHLVPCEQVSDNALGYYDLVGETFYPPYTGFAGAVSLGYDGSHYVMQTVGTPEAIYVDELPSGYIPLEAVSCDGNQKLASGVTGIGSRIEATVKVEATGTDARALCTYDSNYSGTFVCAYAGTSWGVSATQNIAGSAAVKNVVEVVFDRNSSNYNRATVTVNGTSVTYSRTNSRDTKNLFFFNALGTTASAFSGKCWGIKIYNDSTNELLFDARPCIKVSGNKVGFYDMVGETFIESTGANPFVAVLRSADATAVDLLGVGDYADTQEIIGGAITRKVGIKVFDGTEDWSRTSARAQVTLEDSMGGSSLWTPICSHYKPYGASTTLANMDDNSIKYNGSGTTILWKDSTHNTSLDDWKAWVKAQYDAGTPIIVIYPLAEQTTESVAAQPLHTHSGNNTISVTAEVSPIALSATYIKEAS